MPKESKSADLKTALGVGPIPWDLISPQPSEHKEDLVSVLVFEVGGQVFAIGVEQTEGVVECPRISPLPSPPDGIIGVASVRGRITIVMDLSIQTNPDVYKRRLILVRGESRLGLLADRIEDVVSLSPKKIRDVESYKGGPEKSFWPVRAYFKSGNRRVPVIDIEQVGEI